MTDILTKIFIKDSENISEPKVRTAYGKFAGGVGIFCNLMLFTFKFIVGTLSGSMSITADAVNNLSDASSSIISLLGFRLAGKPADSEHPYGHARYEYLSGLAVAVIILIIGFELGRSSLDKILHPSAVEFSWITAVVLVASIAVKLWMALFNTKIGKKISSQTLIATAADSRNDVITTSAVLVAAVISRFTDLELDGWMGLFVAAFIIYSGIELIRDTIDPLLGTSPDPELVTYIHNKIMTYPGVLGTHDLMIHDYGPGRQFASVHVEMAAEADVLESHDTIDNIEYDFKTNDKLHLIIHYDPIVTSDETIGNMRKWLGELVKKIDPVITVHDLRMVPGTTHQNLIFDCVVPQNYKMSDSQLKTTISAMVRAEYPDYFCVITIDKSYVAAPAED
ncbi:MAG: cation diffusion facilitator family transporter [Firmicutes bacterium]|nr:cation diffusion facilitator family transporter [Bacillota bacterium]